MTKASSTISGKPLDVSLVGGVATLTMNRPEVLNSLNRELVEAMRHALAEFRKDNSVQALVITGQGRGFCTGIDLKDPIIADGEASTHWKTFSALMDDGMNGLIRDIYNFDRPTIAAVNGVAAGGGIGIALAADIVVAADSAYFAQVFAPKLGLVPDLGCTWHLAHLLGRARAVGLAMLGDRLPAQKAAEWGLIWKAVEDASFEEEIEATVARLLEGAPRALAAVPKAIDHAYRVSLSDQLDHERDIQSVLIETDDFREAVSAFSQKRKPGFTGR